MLQIKWTGEMEPLWTGLGFLEQDLGFRRGETGFPVEVRKNPGGGLFVQADERDGFVSYGEKAQFFRGVAKLCAMVREKRWGQVREIPCFEKTGVMFDASRNAVPKTEFLKGMFRRMAAMGLNLGMMYTEDTYEVEGEPYFGYLRGRYSMEEARQLDDYADALGIELVPCIQTLGHLDRVLHWQAMEPVRDTEDILLAGEEATYRLLEKMILSASRPYRSNRIHLGMDEAANLGLGRYLDKNGYQKGSEIMLRHLERIRQILGKNGLQAMMWSDMYFRMASPSREYYDREITIPQRVVELAPKEISLVYWDYYHHDEQTYSRMLENHQRFLAPTIFAGGIWTWAGPSANYNKTLRITLPALNQCRKHGIREVFATAWGDNGAEANLQDILYGMQLFAEFSYTGRCEQRQLNRAFRDTVGADPQAFLDLSLFDGIPLTEKLDQDRDDVTGLCKRLLYEDPLIPMFEKDLEGQRLSAHYGDLARRYEAYQKENPEFGLLFEFYQVLADTLRRKCLWREQAAAVVRNKDRAGAARLAAFAGEVGSAYSQLGQVWRRLWFSTNKPYGFEVIDIRMGGQVSRFQSAAWRMEQFARGEIQDIEELSVEKLPFCDKRNQWEAFFSACKMTGV